MKKIISAIIISAMIAPCAQAAQDEAIKNGNFSAGLENWSAGSYASVNDGVLTLSGDGEYEERVYQTVSGMENGTYDLSVYTTNTDVSGVCYVYAKSKGHTVSSTAVPISSGKTKIVVPAVTVEDGSCEIGVYVNGTTTLTADDFSFAKAPETRVPFLTGGEISKLTYVEDKGKNVGTAFHYSDGTEGDGLQILAENGFNLARIRVLDNPGKGRGDGTYYLPEYYLSLEDCLDMAQRAKSKGMKIELTIAYSDYWVDGGQQFPPNAWIEGASGLSGDALADYYSEKIYDYTKEVMQAMIEQGTKPEFVSIGNEMQYGMCFGAYRKNNGLYNNAKYIAQLATAGAKAVREIAPDVKIILHSDNGGNLSRRGSFMNALSMMSDYYDVIGVSYYPYYNASVSIDNVVSEFNSLIKKYDKDVIVMESGYNWSELRGDGWEGQLQDSGYYQNIYGESKEGQKAFLTELYAKLKAVDGGRCLGVMYWDPVMLYDGGTYVIGWANKESDDWADANVVSNSNLFDFNGNALMSQTAMKYNVNADDELVITGSIPNAISREIALTVNGKNIKTKTDKYGKYIVTVNYPKNEKLVISAEGYENQYKLDAPKYSGILSNVDFPILELSTKKENGKINYDIKCSQKLENANLITALYDNGKLLDIKINEISGSFDITGNGEYKVKAFIWQNTLEPVTEYDEQ